jgi:hypothetical protein
MFPLLEYLLAVDWSSFSFSIGPPPNDFTGSAQGLSSDSSGLKAEQS